MTSNPVAKLRHMPEAILWLVALGLALWPVWGNTFFLTNDGPCHLYNSRILHDMLMGRDTEFYGEWYHLNPAIEPNWLAHALLVLFQFVLPPIYSEKLLLTAYILGFAWAARYAARTWFPENGKLAFLILPFIFHKVFLLGFYNFAFSVVLMLMVASLWTRQVDQGWKSKVLLGALSLLLSFTHPVCFSIAMGWIATQWLGGWVANLRLGVEQTRKWAHLREAGATALAVLPGILLMGAFVLGRDTTIVPSKVKLHVLWHNFIELQSLVLYHDRERIWPMALSITIGLLMLVAMARRVRWGLQRQDLALVLFGLLVYAYFNQPAQVGQVGIMPERLQPLPFLIIWLWICTVQWPLWVRRIAMLLGFSVAAILFSLRLPDYARSSEAVEEFVSVSSQIRPHGRVLMLDYAPEGRAPNEGPVLSKEAFIYMHIAEYLGAIQPLIVLNNYEANTDWFPLRWNEGRDPYLHTQDGPGFEGWLPTADFEKFRRETGQDIDYVITWCLNEELRQYEGVALMQARLAKDYDEVWVSNGGRTRLWTRKDAKIQ